jgi:hypothetical protein
MKPAMSSHGLDHLMRRISQALCGPSSDGDLAEAVAVVLTQFLQPGRSSKRYCGPAGPSDFVGLDVQECR